MFAEIAWFFSTVDKEELFIICRGDSSQSINLPPIGIINLKQGCEAKSRNIRLAASEGLNMTTEIKIYEKITLSTDLIMDKLSEGFKTKKNPSGPTLQSIIEEAKTLGEDKILKSELSEYKSTLVTTILIGFLITLLTIAFLTILVAYICLYPQKEQQKFRQKNKK